MASNNHAQAHTGNFSTNMTSADLPSSNSYSNIQNISNNGHTTHTSRQNLTANDAANNWGPSTPGPPPQQSPYRPPAPLSNGSRIIQPGKSNSICFLVKCHSTIHSSNDQIYTE